MFLLLLIQDVPTSEAGYARYRELTQVETPCRRADDEDEVTVCARRDAHRQRLPLVTFSDPRNNANDQVAIIETPEARGIVACGKGPFLVHCGKAGVGMTTKIGRGTQITRPPPP